MQQRFDVGAVAPDGFQAMLGVHHYVDHSGVALRLLELVRLRVSQLNGCAFCLGMHVPLARRHGVSEQELALLPAWREAPLFSAGDRAALAWAEALTQLTPHGVPDAVYTEMQAQFSTKEIADVSFAVAEINAWNRLMAASRTPPQAG